MLESHPSAFQSLIAGTLEVSHIHSQACRLLHAPRLCSPHMREKCRRLVVQKADPQRLAFGVPCTQAGQPQRLAFALPMRLGGAAAAHQYSTSSSTPQPITLTMWLITAYGLCSA